MYGRSMEVPDDYLAFDIGYWLKHDKNVVWGYWLFKQIDHSTAKSFWFFKKIDFNSASEQNTCV